MDVMPDYKLIENIKLRLKNAEDIIIPAHVLEGLTTRPATESEIKNLLWNPKNLIHVIVQDRPEGKRYKLYFRKSRNFDWIIVTVFNNSIIRVVTAFPQNAKRIRLKEKWRKRAYRRR